jgi:hypothetical protein
MADVVDKFGVKLWNGTYYCIVKFPDGTSQELSSKTDLTYSQWQTKIKEAWDASQKPPPESNGCPMNDPKCPNYRPEQVEPK